MPLPKCSPRRAYTAILYTFGPYSPPEQVDVERQRVYDIFRNKVGSNLKSGEFTVAFEKSDDGYEHCHVAVGFHREQKPNMSLIAPLKALCIATEDRKVNLGMNYVPRGDKNRSKGSVYQLLRKYLTAPHKKKETDDGAYEFTPVENTSIKDLEAQLRLRSPAFESASSPLMPRRRAHTAAVVGVGVALLHPQDAERRSGWL